MEGHPLDDLARLRISRTSNNLSRRQSPVALSLCTIHAKKKRGPRFEDTHTHIHTHTHTQVRYKDGRLGELGAYDMVVKGLEAYHMLASDSYPTYRLVTCDTIVISCTAACS